VDGVQGLVLGTAVLSGVNTFTLLLIAWRGGRWTGTVDTRLLHLEQLNEQRGKSRGSETA